MFLEALCDELFIDKLFVLLLLLMLFVVVMVPLLLHWWRLLLRLVFIMVTVVDDDCVDHSRAVSLDLLYAKQHSSRGGWKQKI